MNDAVEAREALLAALRRELVGPDPRGAALDCSRPIEFPNPANAPKAKGSGSEADTPEAYRPYRQLGTEDEILGHLDKPTRRYGVGVLYPVQSDFAVADSTGEPGVSGLEGVEDSLESGAQTEKGTESVDAMSSRLRHVGRSGDSDDFEISLANSFQPSSLGLSFLAKLRPGSRVVVSGEGGRYVPLPVRIGEQEVSWNRRIACGYGATFDVSSMPTSTGRARWPATTKHSENSDNLDVCIEAYVRPNPAGEDGQLLTVILVNRENANLRSVDSKCLFQCGLKIEIEGDGEVLPYPTLRTGAEELDAEESGLELLYRDRLTFAIGHGCAANWGEDSTTGRRHVFADILPRFETPSITAEAGGGSGGVPIALLADLSAGSGRGQLGGLVQSYEDWIDKMGKRVPELDERYRKAAERHLEECRRALGRMNSGLDRLDSDPVVRKAFELANRAILLQQAAGLVGVRTVGTDASGQRIAFNPPYEPPNPDRLEARNRGRWYPFQIAFFLTALCSVADDDDSFRECVDLIWFPTGGGKTEAYLGVAAFYLFLRRLRLPTSKGTGVLMRYTLRLLTTDQFQRTSRLVTAMEKLRRDAPRDLGEEPFSIGLWVGGENTPNRRSVAKRDLGDLQSKRRGVRNPFVVDSCPWCGAELGVVHGRLPRNVKNALGYRWDGERGTVVFHCPDNRCDFFRGLPVSVIDEDLYETPPSILIGTVDKFAQLSWRSATRSLFGLGEHGERRDDPPGLIIQDELHLISGPLGSMVGLYESAIEQLCTVDGHKPKIICSTATIRRYAEQVEGLYAREQSSVFPPPGLDEDDSFFARHAKDAEGRPLRGRLYVGVHAPGLQSMQTAQVRTLSALLQSPMSLPDDLRDPWWTPLVFFNSLRELGTTLSLVQSDIPDYLDAIRRRAAIPWKALRTLDNPIELTGRISSEDVPAALAALRQKYSSAGSSAVDICLASNMVEVGVDIARLSLMVVVGQPKSTSAYIQATGRVGRDWKNSPGLVVTIYGATKPRDRSHFEKFRTYHERLYAQVEPLSVTPMSEPALERALHAVALAFVRQRADEHLGASPRPFADWVPLLDEFQEALLKRADTVLQGGTQGVKELIEARRDQWRRWDRSDWGSAFRQSDDLPLMVSAGSYVPPSWRNVLWEVPTSLRNVDQECQMEVPVQDLSVEDFEDG